MTQDQHVFDQLKKEFGASPPARIAVAVSGGGDSIALLRACVSVLRPLGSEILAVTVDHGLRGGSRAEAEQVAAWATALDVAHEILGWDRADTSAGNLQAQARTARYALMCDWARARDIPFLVLGHTADDQAETVVRHLARASGVDGLSGMPRRRVRNGVTLVRPFLDVTRAQLRAFLQAEGADWIEDPSNEDMRFERVRIRKAAPLLAELGLTTEALAGVARNMVRAREALDWHTFLTARELVQIDGGDVLIDQRRFRILPQEIARRLLTRALLWIGGGAHPPRGEAISEAISKAREGRTHTLNGCTILFHGGLIWVCREHKAVRGLEAAAGAVWDRRWRLAAAAVQAGSIVRALGKSGLRQCGDWRATGRPYAALIASPAVWLGDDVIAAPFAGWGDLTAIDLIGGSETFFSSILSH